MRDHPGQHAPALIALLAGLFPIIAVHSACLFYRSGFQLGFKLRR